VREAHLVCALRLADKGRRRVRNRKVWLEKRCTCVHEERRKSVRLRCPDPGSKRTQHRPAAGDDRLTAPLEKGTLQRPRTGLERARFCGSARRGGASETRVTAQPGDVSAGCAPHRRARTCLPVGRGVRSDAVSAVPVNDGATCATALERAKSCGGPRAERCSSRAATGARALGAQQLATRRTHGAKEERAGRRLLCVLNDAPLVHVRMRPAWQASNTRCGCSLLDSEDNKNDRLVNHLNTRTRCVRKACSPKRAKRRVLMLTVRMRHSTAAHARQQRPRRPRDACRHHPVRVRGKCSTSDR
jgi:hypothetical protein